MAAEHDDEGGVSYAGMTEVEVIVSLHRNSEPLGEGVFADIPDLSVEDARDFLARYLESRDYRGDHKIRLDYVCGRRIKAILDTKAKTIHLME